jgi:diguanylate cyclase (GGDEF)-like protein
MNDTCEKIHSLNHQAWSGRNKNILASLKLAQQVETMLVDCPHIGTSELVVSMRTQGYCLDHLSRYSEALTTSLKAIELASQLADRRLIASIDNVLGSIYWRLSDYSSSLRHYLHGLELIQTDPDPELEIYLVQGLGILHYEMKEYEEALKYFKRSIESIITDDVAGQAMGLNNIAYTLHSMNDNQQALVYALKAVEIFSTESYSVGKIEAFHTLGSIYIELDHIESAFYYFDESLHLAEQNQNRLLTISALLGICQVHQIRGELEEAERKLLKALQISYEINSLSSQCSVSEQLSKLYKQMGNYQAALEHYEAFHAVYVQLVNKESERRLHNTQVLLEVEAIQKQANLYRALAATDALTGLLSRREFFELGTNVMDQAHRRHAPISLMMIDLDNFKSVNDQYGHTVGDEVLTVIAKRLKNTLRQDDLAGRYGGDEFVILMPDIGLQGCRRIAERCHNALVDLPIDVNALTIWMNVSIGIAALTSNKILSLEALIEQADKALLTAKKNGRNRIVTAAELSSRS